MGEQKTVGEPEEGVINPCLQSSLELCGCPLLGKVYLFDVRGGEERGAGEEVARQPEVTFWMMALTPSRPPGSLRRVYSLRENKGFSVASFSTSGVCLLACAFGGGEI